MVIATRHVLRLCQKNVYQTIRYKQVKVKNCQEYNDKHVDFVSLYERHKDKIVFNSFIEYKKLQLGNFKYYINVLNEAKATQKREYKEKCSSPLPVSLKYCTDSDQLLEDKQEHHRNETQTTFQLPLANPTQVNINENDQKNVTEQLADKKNKEEYNCSDINKWMINYELFDDETFEKHNGVDSEESSLYGTPDPTANISNVPCGGCGALLHCCDPAIPGYLPSEILSNASYDEMKALECQRCHFLKEYNIALDVSVHPEEYEKLLESIRYTKSLVVLMVDLLDYPCSIWPGIVDIIGTTRPIIIVGNKVDLLPGDSIGYLKRVRESLMTEINKTKLGEANIKSTCLISAKTGYGVEELISSMFKIWLAKGDVFLVGCTNVGKSSLFNALLQSDYCKVHATDIIKRATVSRWPGTTLNLLKFPINRPSGWKIYERTQRLKADSKLLKIEKMIRKEQIEGTGVSPEMPTLMGHIGRTFSDPKEFKEALGGVEKTSLTGLDESDPLFAKSKWLYDTPGVIHPDQVLSMLTTEELLITIPKQMITPQTYYLNKGFTIFIGGLARIDFLDCTHPCRFTVFCSTNLPITITKTEDADGLYKEFLGTDLLGAPIGGRERMENWPGLKMKPDTMEFIGEGPKACCGDIVLSSVAWVSVTAKPETVCTVAAWTPEAKGIYRRYPSVLPYAVTLKGKRLLDSPAYMPGKVYVDDQYIKRNRLFRE